MNGNTWLAASGGRTWLAAGGTDVGNPLVRNELTKAAGDTVRLALDFGDLPELSAGADLTGAPTVSATPSGLTITSAQLDTAYLASAKFAGGQAGTDYAVTVTVAVTDGSIVSRTGTLRVV